MSDVSSTVTGLCINKKSVAPTNCDRFFHHRISLRRPKSATQKRVTERQPWGMEGAERPGILINMVVY